MTSDVNWGLVIASGIVAGLLILILITGLYLVLSPPPASEPLGTPDGMLADGGYSAPQAGWLGLAPKIAAMPAEPAKSGTLAQKG